MRPKWGPLQPPRIQILILLVRRAGFAKQTLNVQDLKQAAVGCTPARLKPSHTGGEAPRERAGTVFWISGPPSGAPWPRVCCRPTPLLGFFCEERVGCGEETGRVFLLSLSILVRRAEVPSFCASSRREREGSPLCAGVSGCSPSAQLCVDLFAQVSSFTPHSTDEGRLSHTRRDRS